MPATAEMIEAGWEKARPQGVCDQRSHKERFVEGLNASLAATPPPGAHVMPTARSSIPMNELDDMVAAAIERAAQVAESYDETGTLTAPHAIAADIRALSTLAATTEAYCSEGTDNDDLKECFLHHVRTTIGFLAFGARTGPEMTMYEEGFKAGYHRCQSDNEPELGEDEDALPARARKLVGKLRESIRAGAVQLADVEDAIDLIIDQGIPSPETREAGS